MYLHAASKQHMRSICTIYTTHNTQHTTHNTQHTIHNIHNMCVDGGGGAGVCVYI